MAALSRRTRVATLVLCLTTVACGSSSDGASDTTTGDSLSTVPNQEDCAHVVDARLTIATDGTFTVSATVASADTGWDKYADEWEVRDPDGVVLGTRVLAHPHETEQPFTRSLSGVEIPMGVDRVVLAARDSRVGWCGETFEAAVPR